MSTLSDGSTTLTLPDELTWSDELGWSPVVQNVTTTLTGALIIESATLQTGRPITLAGDGSAMGWAWIPYATLRQIRAWASVAGRTLTLTLRGTAYTVVFRHHDKPAVDATPLIDYTEPADDDLYVPTLKFTVIS